MIVLSVLLVCLTALFAQLAHYKQMNAKQKYVNLYQLSNGLQEKIKELDGNIKEFKETKAKVDSLVLRAGFKS